MWPAKSLDAGANNCVFTLGGDGAYFADRNGTEKQVPAYEIDLVDSGVAHDFLTFGLSHA